MSLSSTPATSSTPSKGAWAETKLAAFDVAHTIWSAAKWTGGALSGEFNTKQTTGQIIIDAVISMFPVAGEITSARDATAIIIEMSDDEKKRNDTWKWVALVLCLVAVVPLAGGLVKGVGKLLLRAAETGANAEKLAKLAEEILAFLRKMGYGDVQKWLKELDFSKFQQPLINAVHEALDRIGRASTFIVNHASMVLPQAVRSYLSALPSKLTQIQNLASKMVPQSIKELNALLNKVRNHLVDGTYIDHITVVGGKTKVMTREARLAEQASSSGESLGHVAAESATNKKGWPEIKFPDDKGWPINTFSKLKRIEPVMLHPGQTMFRVIDTSRPKVSGFFWTDHLPPDGTTWRKLCAIMHDWSKNGAYARLTIPTREQLLAKGIKNVPEDWTGMRLWKGRIAEQIDSDGGKEVATGRLLPGGDIQYYVDFKDKYNAPIKAWIALFEKELVKPTHWKDLRIPSQAQAHAVYLEEQERSAKIIQEGYIRRGAATAGKQTDQQANQ